MLQINSIFMIFIFLLGFTLTVSSWKVDDQMKAEKCSSEQSKSSNKGVLVLGLVFMISSLCFFVCLTQCDCAGASPIKALEQFGFTTINIYAGFTFIAGIIILTMGSIIYDDAKKSDCEKIKTPSYTIWLCGFLMVMSSGLYLTKEIYDKYGNTVRTKIDQMRQQRVNFENFDPSELDFNLSQ